MDNEVFKNYLKDLGYIIKELALEAKAQKDKSKDKEEEIYYTGYLMGFHRIISLMQQQASGFRIPLKSLSLEKLDPDKDLI